MDGHGMNRAPNIGDGVRDRGFVMDYYAFMSLLGLVGSAFVIAAFFANQQGWVVSADWRYSLANLVGALLILVSLYAEWNLPSAVIEAFWAAISLYGLWRWWRAARAA
jgi:hypothetical protein